MLGMKTGYLEAGKMVINSVDPEGVPGGSVVKNPPANAGDMGFIRGLGQSHMQQSN